MQKLLVTIPDSLYTRFRRAVPDRQRSRLVVELIEAELEKQEKLLYQAALAVEQDEELTKEMLIGERAMFKDGLENDKW